MVKNRDNLRFYWRFDFACPHCVLARLPQITPMCLVVGGKQVKKDQCMSKKLAEHEQRVELRTRLPKWLMTKLETRAAERARSLASGARVG